VILLAAHWLGHRPRAHALAVFGFSGIVEVAAEHGLEMAVPIAKCVVGRELDRTRISRPHSYLPVEREGACEVYSTML
jgi:hypothetical protein